MVSSKPNKYPIIELGETQGYRLINSKYPPIHLFESVASAADFEILYELQALTNPRIAAEVGNLELLDISEIPFAIRGCSYASSPFTHVNILGSRFSDGSFGVMYIGDTVETALAEVEYHQNKYFQNVEGLKFDRFVFRVLHCEFASKVCADLSVLPVDDPVYDSENYDESQAIGRMLKCDQVDAVQYRSVRKKNGLCWGLFTPRFVKDVFQCSHYEMVYDGQNITSTLKILE